MASHLSEKLLPCDTQAHLTRARRQSSTDVGLLATSFIVQYESRLRSMQCRLASRSLELCLQFASGCLLSLHMKGICDGQCSVSYGYALLPLTAGTASALTGAPILLG